MKLFWTLDLAFWQLKREVFQKPFKKSNFAMVVKLGGSFQRKVDASIPNFQSVLLGQWTESRRASCFSCMEWHQIAKTNKEWIDAQTNFRLSSASFWQFMRVLFEGPSYGMMEYHFLSDFQAALTALEEIRLSEPKILRLVKSFLPILHWTHLMYT